MSKNLPIRRKLFIMIFKFFKFLVYVKEDYKAFLLIVSVHFYQFVAH